MRTTVRLPDELLRRAKRKAAEDDRTLTSLIEEGLNLVLARGRRRRPQRERVEVPVLPGTGGLLPGIELNHSAALLDRLDEDEWSSRT
jgi:hypothetical protein